MLPDVTSRVRGSGGLLAQARLWGVNVSQLRTLTSERALTVAGPALALARPMSWQEGQRLLRANRPLVPAPRVAARSAAG